MKKAKLKKTHYEALGIEKDATAETIKRAYRAKAVQTHPDKPGGDKNEFAEVARAYEVLSDPERRQLYDATGQDARTPIAKAVNQILMKLFADAIRSDNEDVPMLEMIKGGIKDGLATIPDHRKKLEEQKKKLTAKRKKITASGPENLAHMIIDGEIHNIDGTLAQLAYDHEVGTACLEALKDYSEDWQAPRSQAGSVYFVFDPYVGNMTR